jgi:RNA polymerase sigma factor (sigma-70 family)
MEQPELIPHLFRTEFRKITTVLARLFGIAHLETAEDIASETFLAALETWPYQGVPVNPTAWLYSVAKNKARNVLSREQLFADKIASQMPLNTCEKVEIDWSESHIADSQLQMLFALCHPTLSAEAQIGLSLRILCGFGIAEIANAFLTNKETIHKRLFRAREKLRLEKAPIEFPAPAQIGERLKTVLTTLYLLYNEGYYSESQDTVLRKDFCLEAMRLTYLLIENPATNQPEVNALFALMCFHTSRFEARSGPDGEMVLYEDQDESLWNAELIARGTYYLHRASQGGQLSRYHLEAAIAYWHTIKADTPEKWSAVLQLYNHLLVLEYSPIAALNRTYALSKVKGKAAAIAEAKKLNLSNSHFYFTLLGELYIDIDPQQARQHFQRALELARTATDKRTLQVRLEKL